MNGENDLIFHETQRHGWDIIFICIGVNLIPASFICLLYFLCPMAIILLIFWAGFIATQTFFLGIGKLITKVDADGLYVRFFPINRHFKKIPIHDITEYHIKTYSNILDCGKIWFGGKRYNSSEKTWAYVARGNKGILIVLKTGKKLLIGSQNPEELVTAIDSILKK